MTGIIGEIVTGLLGIIGMVWVAVISRRSSNRAADLTSAATWISRIQDLEQQYREVQAQFAELRLDFTAAIGMIDAIGWRATRPPDQRGPLPPLPHRLRRHVSHPDIWPTASPPKKEGPS